MEYYENDFYVFGGYVDGQYSSRDQSTNTNIAVKKSKKRINKTMAFTIAEFVQQQPKSVFGLKQVIENFGFHDYL